MIGIVLVTHGNLAREFVSIAEHIVGKQPHMQCVCIEPNDDMEQCRNNILAAVKQVEQGDGVAVLTDMFGGTPSNLAISTMATGTIDVIAGINLPMLIKLISVRTSASLSDALLMSQEAGRKYINVASNLLQKK